MSDQRTSKITIVVTVLSDDGPSLGWLAGQTLLDMFLCNPGTFYATGGGAEYRVREVTVEDVEV